MNILYSSIHSIDIDGKATLLREKENDFDEAISSHLANINSEKNLRKYKEKSDSTTIVVEKALELCDILIAGELTDKIFSEKNVEIANKLLDVEVSVEEQNMRTHKTQVQRGSLVQAIVYRDRTDEYEYYIAKLEHNEFYIEENFSKTIGFQSNKAEVYKSCRFKISMLDGNSSINYAEVYVNNGSKYWADRFLELVEINDDQVNTRKAFNSIDALLTKMIKTNHKSDYLTLRNGFIGYFRTSVRDINFYEMIDEMIDGYNPFTATEKIMQNFKEELIKLPTKQNFDTQFTIDPTAIKGRKYTSHQVNNGIELILNKNGKIDDFENTIFAEEENGIRYIKIVTNDTDTYESFNRKKTK